MTPSRSEAPFDNMALNPELGALHTELHDILDDADIKRLVDGFYARVNRDDLLAPVFNEFAHVNWSEHLPLLYTFWSTLLFRSATYKGQPFPKHVMLPVAKEHFGRWVDLFIQTVEELFKGPKANEAKGFAQSIADTFQRRMGLSNEWEQFMRPLKTPNIQLNAAPRAASLRDQSDRE
jgi:hemoglobin